MIHVNPDRIRDSCLHEAQYMSEYVVSARKYRPDSFESLVGQENIARTLKNSIKRGQLAHAYLFCGPRGVGKTSTARIFAKTINCADPGPDMEPCGKCESCLSFAEGRSYCIHELDAASNNGVDDIKALIDQVRIPPQTGKYSVYIIDEVHMLSSAAFNAFLKTLEEPPAYAIFILATTEKHKILPTILSRCQTYDFNRITVDGIVGNLKAIAGKEGISIDDESLHVIAMKADGAMRDALTIFDQTVAFCGREVKYAEVIKNLNVLDYEYSFSLTDAFLAGDYKSAFLKFDEILSKGFNALHFVSALSSHFRDLLVSRTSGLEALLDLPESLKLRYREQSARCPLPFIYEAMNITVQCESAYRSSINPRFLIELTLMKLSTLMSRLSGQPVLGGVQAKFAAKGRFVFEITLELRAQKVHHHGAGHGGVFGVHAVGLQPPGGALAPAGLHAALGVAVHVEPVAFLLRVGEHLLPMQVDDLVAAADVVVHVAVDGLVVIHAAGHQHFRLVAPEQPQVFGVQQLADLGGIAAAFQFQFQQKVALIFAHGVLIQNQKIQCQGAPPGLMSAR